MTDRENTIYQGHTTDVLRALPDESVHCVITSPPYWGLRDYGIPPVEWDDGWKGSLGLEPTPEMYVQHIVMIFREVRRVLRSDGTLWLNMGDSYAGSWGNYGTREGNQRSRISEKWHRPAYEGDDGYRELPPTANCPGLKPKDLVCVPWLVGLALRDDGWWLRRPIIWAKKNPMPESVTDRPTVSYEYILLMTKSARYFYDAEAVKELWTSGRDDMRKHGLRTGTVYLQQSKVADNSDKGSGRSERNQHNYQGGRNLRDVWSMATHPYPEAHFATFPPELPEKCINAGTSEKGVCPECGAPWIRVTKPTEEHEKHLGKAYNDHDNDLEQGLSQKKREGFKAVTAEYITIDWRPGCECDADPVPATVLDPFSGAGTTGLVALRLNRRYIGIELKQEYIDMSIRRIVDDAPLLNRIEAA